MWGCERIGVEKTIQAAQKGAETVVVSLSQMLLCVHWLKRWLLCPMDALWLHRMSALSIRPGVLAECL